MRNAIVRWRKVIFALAAAALAATPLRGQSDSCLRRIVPVNVLTAKGETVTGLTPENFKASAHHKPVKILSVTEDKAPRRVVIVLDSSGSMASAKPAWRTYVEVARELTQLLPPGSAIGLVAFTTKIERSIALTNDRSKIQHELAWLQTGAEALKGRTALWDALSVAAFTQFEAPQEGDAIYVISDAGENSSKTDLSQLRKTLLEKRIRLFAFSQQLGPIGPTPEERAGPTGLRDLVESTGGYAISFSPNVLGNMPEFTDTMGKPTREGALVLMQFREILTFNRVEIELPERFEKIQEWKLEIAGLTAPYLFFTCPHRLVGCGAAPAATKH